MEAYFRRAIQKIGWLEVDGVKPMTGHPSSQLPFHARFNIGDLEGVASDLKPN